MLIQILAFATLQIPTATALKETAAQTGDGVSEAEQLLSGTKRCPDGSVVRTIDRCAEMPDHRFEVTHEPARQVRTRRWWCRESPRASEITVTIELRPPDGPNSSRQVSRLNGLVVNGRPASENLKRSVQQQIDSFHRFDSFGGRCLFVRSGGTVPVLTLHGVVMNNGELNREHKEIPLG